MMQGDSFKKSTTRIQRPPGGFSSLSLAWEEDTTPRGVPNQRRSDTSCVDSSSMRDATFGRRPRESSNRFANGADQNSGNFITDTPTTRVHAPPGGRSSINLGGDRAQSVCDRKATRKSTRGDASCAGSSLRDVEYGRRPREGSNRFANGANQNCGNFITDTPTTRVNAPPGGRSSISFGAEAADSGCDRKASRRSTREDLSSVATPMRVSPGDVIDHSKLKCLKKKMSPKSDSTCVSSSTSRAQQLSNCSSVVDEVLWGSAEFEVHEEDDLPLGADWEFFYMSRR